MALSCVSWPLSANCQLTRDYTTESVIINSEGQPLIFNSRLVVVEARVASGDEGFGEREGE